MLAIGLDYAIWASFVVETKIIKLIILAEAAYYMLFMSTLEFIGKTKIINFCYFGFVQNLFGICIRGCICGENQN